MGLISRQLKRTVLLDDGMGIKSGEPCVIHGIQLDPRPGSRFVAQEEHAAGRMGFEAI